MARMILSCSERKARGFPRKSWNPLDYEDTCIRIPMLDRIRSLNLSNSVSIVLYEALRQQDFAGMQMEGALHRMEWKDGIIS